MPELNQIKASAGSGKTWTLTGKFLERLFGSNSRAQAHSACTISSSLAACCASEILAITFTNDAAAEMRSRVFKRLKEAALGLKKDGIGPKEAEKWLEALMRDMSSLNIRTIDSLLHMIVRASAIDLNINPDFQPTFDTVTAIQPYLDRILQNAVNDEECALLIKKSCQALIDYGVDGFTTGDRLAARLVNVLDACLADKFSDMASEEEIASLTADVQAQAKLAAQNYIDAAEVQGLKWSKLALNAVMSIIDGAKVCTSVYAHKNTPEEMFLKASRDRAYLVEGEHGAFVAAVGLLNSYGPLLRKAKEYEPFIKLANRLAKDFRERMNLDLILPACIIPGLVAKVMQDGNGVSDAICRLGSKLTHFLLDEFQDTSQEQWAALKPLAMEALSRGGSLTWVGDVKQSIYYWRGADSSLFDSLAIDRDLLRITGDDQLHTHALDTNWRSKRQVVNFINNFFAPLSDINEAGDALNNLLKKSLPENIVNEAARRLSQSFQDVWQLCADKSDLEGFVSGCHVQADGFDNIHEAISNELGNLLLYDIGKRRPWSDVMVLVRSNEQARKAALNLIDLGIPVITENSLLLAEHPLIIQTLALLEFLDDPENDLAFFTLIAGSIFLDNSRTRELDWQSLHEFAARPRKIPLWQDFAATYPDLWQTSLNPFYRQGSLWTPYDIVMEWYARMDVLRRFPEDATILRRFMEVAQRAEEQGLASIASFLNYWQNQGGEEKAPMPEYMNAVRIMTIHKAKGLEAPVAIVPWTSFEISPSNRAEKVSLDGKNLAAIVSNTASGDLYKKEMVNQALEAINLLYVAMTRARDELYFFSSPGSDKRINLKSVIDRLWARSKLAEGSFELGKRITIEDVDNSSEEPEISRASASGADDIPADSDWRPMQWLPRLKIYQNSPYEAVFSAKARGIFLHYCLEHMQFGTDMEAETEAAFEFGLHHSGLHVPHDENLRQRMLSDLRWFVTQPQARDWLENGWPEQSMLDAKGKMLRTDLLVPRSWGVLIIDYKSGQPEDAHIKQVQNYINCLADSGSFKGKVLGLLVYLDARKFRQVNAGDSSALLDSCPIF